MMTRQERAKQFMPFDAMKGLQQSLREREERHSRVQRHEISEEQQTQNSLDIAKLKKGMEITIDYYSAFHDVSVTGQVTNINTACHFLILDEEKIFFDDIYKISFSK